MGGARIPVIAVQHGVTQYTWIPCTTRRTESSQIINGWLQKPGKTDGNNGFIDENEEGPLIRKAGQGGHRKG